MWSQNINRIGVYINSEYDREMNLLLNTVSRHAVDLVKLQYEFALLSSTSYRYYPLGPYVMMQYTPSNDTSSTDEDLPDEYMINPDNWTCSCIFRVTRLLPCRQIIFYRKAIGCDHIVPESIIHPRWLVKNYRKMKQIPVPDDAVDPYEERQMPTLPTARAKTHNEKFKELFAVGKHIADVGCEWGTSAHITLMAAEQKFLQCVKAGHCPEVIMPGERIRSLPDRDETLERRTVNSTRDVSYESTPSEAGIASESGVSTEPGAPEETGVQPVLVVQSQTDCCQDEDLPTELGERLDGEGNSHLSPSSIALYSLMDELDSSSLHQGYSSNIGAVSDAAVQSENVPDTLYQSENVQVIQTGPRDSRDNSSTHLSENEMGSSARPEWTINKTSSRAGRVKGTHSLRKMAKTQALRQTSRFVAAVAAGNAPSLAVLLDAIKEGVTYKHAPSLRALSVLQQIKRAKITVFEKRKKQPTPTDSVMNVLPIGRLATCDTQVAHFQNRWFSDYISRISQHDVTVMTAGWCMKSIR
ncbi:hypothetical protein GN958_ATG09782 [Phytophthora infestans]|uniref:SWIM-type domain-containing protein n=1 Tax=Phytophthora infestans TaxID=4787 RepID=A0A8S9UPE3_PHYIN|nr:hypothetical protein GN958_ATG09782 [Phytophthora infestans]